MMIQKKIWGMLLLVIVFGLSCTSENSTGEVDGGVLYGDNCISCHSISDDGTSGVTEKTSADIHSALSSVSAMSSLSGSLTDSEITSIASFLANMTHESSWSSEDDHGGYVESNGTSTCIKCHGTDLRGLAYSTSCYECHDQEW